jgi:hypothetical protein
MKRNLLTAAVAAALGAAAAPAFALLPGASIGNETYISGASAQEGQLINFMRYGCNAGTLDVFKQSNQFIYACTRNATRVGTSAANIVVYKSSVGGSGNGVLPVAQAATLAFMDFATLNTSTQCSAPVAKAATSGLIAYNEYTCTQPTVNRLTEIGLSDVEPAQFIGILPGLTSTLNNRLQVNSSNQVLFGIPATKALRDALQSAQGLTVGGETEADMPSLSKSQIAGIYTGSIVTWDQLGLTNAGDPYNAIWVARRVSSSGTQTGARIHFLNDPCVPNMAQFVTDGAAPPNGDAAIASDAAACSSVDPLAAGYTTTYQGSGSGNVVQCLKDHHANGRWAIGVLSTEFVPGTDNYRFVKIDGVAPTTYNAGQGRYHYVTEATNQWRKSSAPSPLGGDDLAFANSMKNGFNNPTVIAAINTGLVQTWGQGGLLGVPGANLPSDPITTANIVTNPVNAFTHSASGSTNNCQPLQPIAPGSKTGFNN